MPSYVDLDSIYRATTGSIVPASWMDQVNDDVKYLATQRWQGARVSITYATGGYTINLPNALANAFDALFVTVESIGGATPNPACSYALVSSSLTAVTFTLYQGATQVANGTTCVINWGVLGH